MSCEEHQSMISRLLDGELPPGVSLEVFAHLAGCGECQLFYHRLQTLNASLDRIAGHMEREAAGGGDASEGARPRGLWKRRVTLRVPVLALLVLAAAAGIFFSFSRNVPSHTTETVYVTRLPAVVITDDTKKVD